MLLLFIYDQNILKSIFLTLKSVQLQKQKENLDFLFRLFLIP